MAGLCGGAAEAPGGGRGADGTGVGVGRNMEEETEEVWKMMEELVEFALNPPVPIYFLHISY